MIKASNPITILQDQIGSTGVYAYKTEIFIGGVNGSQIYIGTPTVSLKDSEEIRLLYPNEARLRNLTYASNIDVDIVIKLTYAKANPSGGPPLLTEIVLDPVADPTRYGYLGRFPLCQIPIMLHSRYCILHAKPQSFLTEAGECQYD
jgi:DNA-directed RNA polymerase beta subunit